MSRAPPDRAATNGSPLSDCRITTDPTRLLQGSGACSGAVRGSDGDAVGVTVGLDSVG